ncbi:MAG TPA: hypothetical protein VFJ43_00545, partial [Bacteroidia bacterium]|nr:hypothetical protein [Bacteroidia bacterium]
HGIGDYYFILDPTLPKGNLYCIFSEEYKRYLGKKGESSQWVKPLPGIENFPVLAAQLLKRHAKTLAIDQLPVPEKPCVFVLLEAVDLYNVKSTFWAAYLDRIFAQLGDPSHYHYLLKPHPMQSEVSIVATRALFEQLGYEFTLLNHPAITSASAEILFSLWEKKTEHVFCLYSSGCFYLSKLYAKSNIRFWYSTSFMSKNISNAPPVFYKGFITARPIIDEVFTGNCTAYE